MENKDKKAPGKWFFGWTNIKWFISEIGNIMSDEPSYFSQKRIQQLVAFIVLEWGAIYFLINKWATMSTSDFVLWATVQGSIAGFILHHVQKEKKQKHLNDG